MSPNKRVLDAYRFFCAAEREGRGFTVDELASATGWKASTVSTYITKKWSSFIQKVGDGFETRDILSLSEDIFLRLHSQKTTLTSEILRPRFGLRVDTLINKSRESALLAVQTYNNPMVVFRTPGYVVHMVIAYTALFHAIFERQGTPYWYIDKKTGQPSIRDGDEKTWDLARCLKEYYGDKTLPEFENIKFFIDIRNKIEHRYIPAIDLSLSGKCQALLLNFEELLVSTFGQFFALGANLALALQLSRYSQEQQAVLRQIQVTEYEAIRKYSEDYDSRLSDEIVSSHKYSFRAFLIPKLGNHAKSSDVAIEFVHYDSDDPQAMAQYEKQVAFIKERTISVVNKGKYLPNAVVKQVATRTGLRFTMDHHTRAWKLFGVRPQCIGPKGCDTKYCLYDEAHKSYIYTDEWVDFLCEKITDPVEFERIKTYRSTTKKTSI